MTFKSKKIKQNNNVLLENIKSKILVFFKDKKLSSVLRYTLSSLGIFLVVFIALNVYSLVSKLEFDFTITNIVNTFFGQELKTDKFGKTNVLFMGVAGGVHDGPDLTDSIIVASYDHSKKIASLVSIPRDLYVKVSSNYYERINVVYGYYSRNFGKEKAIDYMKDLIDSITGLEIQYYAKVNFQGFKEVIDILGGIDIYVSERLVDETYPVEDDKGVFLRNELFVVEKGLQKMDGETALRYARSRHSTSDFSRSKRQHEVILAIKEKAMKENYLTDANALKRFYYAISSNLETDITIPEMIRGGILAKDMNSRNIISAGLNDDMTALGGFLYTPNREWTKGAAVLIPDGSTSSNMDYYLEINRFIDLITNNQEIFIENASIKIMNGTKVGGLASSLENKLSRYGFNVSEIGNADKNKGSSKTKIYVYSNNTEVTLNNLQVFVPGEIVYVPNSFKEDEENVVVDNNESMFDIEIVIGNDFNKYVY